LQKKQNGIFEKAINPKTAIPSVDIHGFETAKSKLIETKAA